MDARADNYQDNRHYNQDESGQRPQGQGFSEDCNADDNGGSGS